MRREALRRRAWGIIVVVASIGSPCTGAPSESSPYPKMAALDAYLIRDEREEVMLARSAAPSAIADAAEVMVLRRDGYATAVAGSNGFVCIVERSWAKPTIDVEFWNPKMRAPTCFNQAAATTFLPIYLLRTRLVLEGRTPSQILTATSAAFRDQALPPLAPAAMCYMMSSQQYLGDSDKAWHPHVMFFVSDDASDSWGANKKGSPLIGGNDPEEHVTVMMMLSDHWSNGVAVTGSMH